MRRICMNFTITFILLSVLSCDRAPKSFWYNKAPKGIIVEEWQRWGTERYYITVLEEGKDSTVEIPEWLYNDVLDGDIIINK